MAEKKVAGEEKGGEAKQERVSAIAFGGGEEEKPDHDDDDGVEQPWGAPTAPEYGGPASPWSGHMLGQAFGHHDDDVGLDGEGAGRRLAAAENAMPAGAAVRQIASAMATPLPGTA